MCFQVNIENVVYLRSQLASQLEDARRKLEDDERRRSLLEANLHQVLQIPWPCFTFVCSLHYFY